MPEQLPSGFKDKYGPNLFNGLPYTGVIYDRKEDDPPEKQPVLCSKVYTRQFDISKPEDLEAWNSILQKAADHVSEISFEEKVFDKDLKSWRVLVRWLDYFYTNPEGVTDARPSEES